MVADGGRIIGRIALVGIAEEEREGHRLGGECRARQELDVDVGPGRCSGAMVPSARGAP